MRDFPREKYKHIFLLFFVALYLYFTGLSRYHLWKPDEPRYAEVAREMKKRGSIFIPYLNSEIYKDKPPLFFLLISLSYYITGLENEFSARLPSAFFSLLLALFVALWGRKLFGEPAVLGAFVLATSLEFVWIARRANIDNVFSFFITLSLFSFFRWYKSRNPFYLYFFYILMGIGVVTKGPLALFIPIFTSVIFLILRDKKLLKEMKWGIGILLAFLPTAVWLLVGTLEAGLDYIKEIIGMHVLGMYLKGWSHPRPIYYFLYNFPLDFLPWSFFLPSVIVYFYKRKKWHDENLLFLSIWFLFTFVFLSFSKAKRELYLLPSYPAISIIVGYFLHEFSERILKGTSLVFSLFLLVLSPFSFFIINKIPQLSPFKFHISLTFLFASILWLLFKKLKDPLKAAFSYFCSFTIIIMTLASLWILPGVDKYKYPGEVIRVLEGKRNICLFKYRNDQFLFYLKIDHIPVIADDGVESCKYIIVRERHIKAIKMPFKVLAVSRLWKDRVCLLEIQKEG